MPNIQYFIAPATRCFFADTQFGYWIRGDVGFLKISAVFYFDWVESLKRILSSFVHVQA
jgi:hypothetical protein